MKLTPKVRKEMILIAAIRVARRPGGWSSLTRNSVAHEAKCADGLLYRYFTNMDGLRRAVMTNAIKHEYIDLIAQGIAAGYPMCVKLSPVLKHRAIATLL